eukprot:GDKJ01064920.1.p1 GENE.GDKJ01064920.1~~GDKJ01064920.1.p1  ORF type:complete len:377 (+),score=59.44 GDKJ01064920.1:136-1266(+)
MNTSSKYPSGTESSRRMKVSATITWSPAKERSFLIHSLLYREDVSAAFGTVFAMFADDLSNLMSFQSLVELSISLGLIPIEASSERKVTLEFLHKEYLYHLQIRYAREYFNKMYYHDSDGLGITEVAHCLDILRSKRGVTLPTLLIIFRELAVARGPPSNQAKLESATAASRDSSSSSQALSSSSKVMMLNSIISKMNAAKVVQSLKPTSRPLSAASHLFRSSSSSSLLSRPLSSSSPSSASRPTSSSLPYPLSVSPLSPNAKKVDDNRANLFTMYGGPGSPSTNTTTMITTTTKAEILFPSSPDYQVCIADLTNGKRFRPSSSPLTRWPSAGPLYQQQTKRKTFSNDFSANKNTLEMIIMKSGLQFDNIDRKIGL